MMRKLVMIFFCLIAVGSSARDMSGPAPDKAKAKSATVASQGCTAIQKQQICWGKAELKRNANNPHTASFVFTFAKPFANTPTVTNGILVNGAGHTLSVHQYTLDRSTYSGALNNASGRSPIDGTISMNYIAIGDAK